MLCKCTLACFLLDVRLSGCVNREPWGTIKDAVQTSFELSEPVDIKTLPGLGGLSLKHDLNTEGNASHFANSLWLKSQTRVVQYRRLEIKEGGSLVEHVELPLIVDYLDELLVEITWQELLNGWSNQGLGRFLATTSWCLDTSEPRTRTHMVRSRCQVPLMGFQEPQLSTCPSLTSVIEVFYDRALLRHPGLPGPHVDCRRWRGTPTVLHFLTPQLAGQIVQVWAVQTSVFVTPRQIARALPAPEVNQLSPTNCHPPIATNKLLPTSCH